MKSTKILLNLTSFFCFVYFAIYTFSLVFIPIGIYCFIAGKNFSYKAEHLDDTYKMSKSTFKYYVIFVSIFCFPFGLLSIIPYRQLTSNNIVVTDLKYVNTENETDLQKDNQEIKQENENVVETEQEKIEKFQKLQSFKEKGYITEEELEQAREQIFGKKD